MNMKCKEGYSGDSNRGEHDKVFSNKVLASYPPQFPWICKKCGVKGTDSGIAVTDNEYDTIMRKFQS